MRKLSTSEFSKVLSLNEALKENGYYAEVDNDMKVRAMCIYLVKDGCLYDDISLDCECGAWDAENLQEMQERGSKLAKLTKDYSEIFEYYKDQIA